jgi:hypothetical protein
MKHIDKSRVKSKIVMLSEKQGGEEQYANQSQLQDDPKYTSNVREYSGGQQTIRS